MILNIVVLEEVIDDFVNKLHCTNGRNKLYNMLKNRWYIKYMSHRILEAIKPCGICLRAKYINKYPIGQSRSIVTDNISQMVTVDFL